MVKVSTLIDLVYTCNAASAGLSYVGKIMPAELSVSVVGVAL